MGPHSIDTWVTILGKQDATHCSAEFAVANRILGDLVGYKHISRFRQRDAQELANAIQAYVRIVQQAGVTV